MPPSPHAGLWLAIATVVLAFLFCGYAIWSVASSSTGDSRLVQRLQRQWKSPLLMDRALSARLVQILAAPLQRENLRLTLKIGSVQPNARDFAEGIARIRVDVDLEFDLYNVGERTIVASYQNNQGEQTAHLGEKLVSLSVDGQKAESDIEIKPVSKRRLRLTSVQVGTLPHVAVFEQKMPVRAGAEVHLSVSGGVRCSLGLLVTGAGDYAWYKDKWWNEGETLSHDMNINDCLLPGDSIILTLGA